MDDHMIYRINEEIKLCFLLTSLELKKCPNKEENINFRAAKELIKTYNALVRLYYKPEYHKDFLYKSINHSWKQYIDNDN